MLRKAVFEIGPKSIFLYLFFAFAFNGKASNATYTEFGCKFVNNEYKMERNPNTMAPIWSENGIGSNIDLPIEPKDSYWQPIVDYLSEVSIMNDVSPLAKFVKTYNTNTAKKTNTSLESFFDNYNVPFQLNETKDPASYIIQMFHKLKDNHRNQKPVLEHYYLVSALVQPTDMDISIALSDDASAHTKRAELVQKMQKTRVQDHVAGIIKITSGKRTGYILIDPGYATKYYPRKNWFDNEEKFVQPFVVFLMEDGNYPHKTFVNEFSRNDQTQFTVKQGVPFILAKHTYSDTEINVLYYIGKPYCSFIENTIKMNLLRRNSGIIERDSKQKKEFYLRFQISGSDSISLLQKTNNLTTLDIHIRLIKNKVSIVNYTRPFDERDGAREIKLADILSKRLNNINVATITEELEYITNNVYEDKKFLNNFIDLSKKLSLSYQYISEDCKEESKSLPGKTEKSVQQKIIGGLKTCFSA